MAVTTSEYVTYLALAATSIGIGYSLGLVAARRHAKSKTPSKNHSTDGKLIDEYDSESDLESDDDLVYSVSDGDLGAIMPTNEPCKLVLVVRTDLNMTPGKIAAQCGHATLACFKAMQKTNPQIIKQWERLGQAKIALRASSEDELIELEAIAKSLNLCARPVIDAGRTQVAPSTRTVLGVGPAPASLINQVTGKLRLL
ncbi:hypothetical protein QCA50_001558 [Cerrena zonata]|uniref:peptidyl-tRNA hydrolase n=1 Tax=Cerrena zonata TaxID=2478898 RepID=A0AAW0GNX5_9APHY